jgi:hypothetical protein
MLGHTAIAKNLAREIRLLAASDFLPFARGFDLAMIRTQVHRLSGHARLGKLLHLA